MAIPFMDKISVSRDGDKILDLIREEFSPPSSTILEGMLLCISPLLGQSLGDMTIGFLRGVAYSASLRDAMEGRKFVAFPNGALESTEEIDRVLVGLRILPEAPLMVLIGGRTPLSVTCGYLTQLDPELTSTLLKELTATRALIVAYNERRIKESAEGNGKGESHQP